MIDYLAEQTKLWEDGHCSLFMSPEFFCHYSLSRKPHLLCFNIHRALLHWHSRNIRGNLVTTSEYTRNSCNVKVIFWRKYKIQLFKTNYSYLCLSMANNASLMLVYTKVHPSAIFPQKWSYKNVAKNLVSIDSKAIPQEFLKLIDSSNLNPFNINVPLHKSSNSVRIFRETLSRL